MAALCSEERWLAVVHFGVHEADAWTNERITSEWEIRIKESKFDNGNLDVRTDREMGG